MIVVCDSSPLIALSIIDRLNLLDSLFKQVLIPVSVFNEASMANKPEATQITEWAKNKVVVAKNRQLINSFNLLLDVGEAEAMALYFEEDADFLLIDEKKGREIASFNKINVVGSLGILLMSKKKGLIPSVEPLLNRLQQSSIRISDELHQKTLELAGE